MAKRGISPSKAQQKLARSLGTIENWREGKRKGEYTGERQLMSETRQHMRGDRG